MILRLSSGGPNNLQRTSWERPISTSQGRPLEVRLGFPLDVILGGLQDGQVESLGDVLGTNNCRMGKNHNVQELSCSKIILLKNFGVQKLQC